MMKHALVLHLSSNNAPFLDEQIGTMTFNSFKIVLIIHWPFYKLASGRALVLSGFLVDTSLRLLFGLMEYYGVNWVTSGLV